MKYIMVTNWEGHWDNLPGGKTYYTLGMLKGRMDENRVGDNVETVFIKLNKSSKEVEKVWVGRTSNFKKGEKNNKKVIYFSITLDKEIECPEAYRSYTEGWYMEEALSQEEDVYSPPFFSKLRTTRDWNEFENLTYYLLKILGIHDVYKFEVGKQKGKSDGFFIFKNTIIF